MALTQVPIELSSTPGIVDNSNATAITIDSSENVGIGCTPSRNLDIQGTGDTLVSIVSPAANQAALFFGDTDSDSVGRVAYDNSDNSMRFNTNGSEAMRIDSGNLLVGTTTINGVGGSSSPEGVVLDGNNAQLTIGTSSDVSATFNRQTTDGNIVQFRKDGSIVGSIGTGSGDLNINGPAGHSGIRFQASSILPRYNGADTDGTVDLGYDDGTATHRWRNLYLSGGVVFGSTGGVVTSKTLDDYEEGNFQPSIIGSGASQPTITYGHNTGTYTKVGRLVTLIGYIEISSISGTTSGNLNITGLPFAQLSGNGYAACSAFSCTGLNFARPDFGSVTQYQSATLGFLTQNNNNDWNWELVNILSAGDAFRFSITYHTAA
jgi:hypothetical protein